MENGSGNKLLPISVLIILIVIGGLLYFFKYKKTDTPSQVLTPKSYPEGSKVATYNQVPSSFPVDVILAGAEFKRASMADMPGQESRVTVTYISEGTVESVFESYQKSFIDKGWTVERSELLKKSAVIQVKQKGKSLTLAMAPYVKNVMLTFQYAQ